MLVIFDCDGVLIDSEAIYCSVDAAALTDLGHPTTPGDIARRFTGVPHHVAWSTLATELGFEQPPDLLDRIRAECLRRFDTELVAITDAAEALRTVVALGHATCVASSTSLAGLRRNLERTGLLELLDPHVFSASQVKRGKPAPDVFLYAASQMGADPADCLVIEDSVAGTTAARRAGMDVVGFTGGSHVDDELADRLQAAGARRIFTSQGQLVRWLRNGGRPGE
jgi:HAD superfamily hydrolase (TIGR01509 family)